MSLLSSPTRAMIVAAAACLACSSGGGDGGGGPSPVVTADITSFMVTPGTILQGDTVRFQATGSASDGSLDGIRINAPNGSQYLTATGGSLDLRAAPTAAGGYTAVPVEPNATTTTKSASLAITPLTLTAALDKTSLTIGDSAFLTLTAPAGTDSVTADFAGTHAAFPGPSGSRYIKPGAAGTTTITSRAHNLVASVAGEALTLTTAALPIPSALVRMQLTPASVLAGSQTRIGGKIFNVQNGKADSVAAFVAGSRLGGALGDSLDLPYAPSQSDMIEVRGYISRADNSAPQVLTTTLPVSVLYRLRIQLVDMDRNPVTQSHTMPIDGINYVSDAAGLITANLPAGIHTIGYARRYPADTTATRLELPAGYPDRTRIIFPRFKISQAAAAGADTLALTGSTDATAEIAGLGANFNKEHHAGYFDDQIYGQQGPRGTTVRFHILKQPNASYPLCQAIAQGTLDTWRQFQTDAVTDLAANYSVINTEGDVLPASMPSGEQVILCQGPIVGAEIFRETNGAEKISVAYLGSSTPLGAAYQEAMLAPYGSSGIEGKCTVPSVFNDSNPEDIPCSIGSATITAFDHREGLDMMRDFAIPANVRALVTNTVLNGTTKIFFSLRP